MSFSLRSQTVDSLAFSDEEDTCRIKIVKLKLNSREDDFAPVVCNNKMLFTSSRPASFGVVYQEPGSEHTTGIYYAEKKDSIHFSEPKLWPGTVNTHYNEGNAALNREENLLIYTGNERNASKKSERTKLCLYACEKIGGKWQEPQPLWFCGDGYSYCHPALQKDGKTLFFASDRPGSAGGMDIYCSIFTNGKWNEPQNVGSKVNTSFNEIFPAISENNTLYFSSNRPGGIGGLDIYALNLNDPIESELVVLESPVNSTFDDFGIFPDSTGESGYFSSSRDLKNKDEIYYYRVTSPDFKDATTPVVRNTFCYTFYEETSPDEFNTDSLVYEWDLGDGTVVRGAKAKHCYTKCGTYTIQLNIVEKNTGALFYNQVSYDHIIPEPEQLKIEYSDELLSNQKLKFCCEGSAIPGYSIQQTFWIFGDQTYSYGNKVKHLYKTKGTYTVTLGVIAKNNNTGQVEKFKTEKTITVRDNF
ncbi:MAG: hypothetical protein K0S33_1480 [Bacteroidetes bacterium]|nr:hypothetical protein [Bacteroidota bacterium]